MTEDKEKIVGLTCRHRIDFTMRPDATTSAHRWRRGMHATGACCADRHPHASFPLRTDGARLRVRSHPATISPRSAVHAGTARPSRGVETHPGARHRLRRWLGPLMHELRCAYGNRNQTDAGHRRCRSGRLPSRTDDLSDSRLRLWHRTGHGCVHPRSPHRRRAAFLRTCAPLGCSHPRHRVRNGQVDPGSRGRTKPVTYAHGGTVTCTSSKSSLHHSTLRTHASQRVLPALRIPPRKRAFATNSLIRTTTFSAAARSYRGARTSSLPFATAHLRSTCESERHGARFLARHSGHAP